MLNILESIAKATVEMTIAEFYLHPEVFARLEDKDGLNEFTSVVEIMVALARNLDFSHEQDQIKYTTDAVTMAYKEYANALKELTSKMGKSCWSCGDAYQVAALHGSDQVPVLIRPAAQIK